MQEKTFSQRTWFFLGAILIIAAILRLPFLYDAPVFGDEAQYLIRSAGWIDTFLSDVQTTPLDWFQDPPWWTRISFHDHPPLGFGVLHFFTLLFGPTLWAGRFASAVIGIASIPLLFLIGKRLFSERAGFVAAALFAINSFAILYHRVIMLESALVFFVLLSISLFLRAREEKKFWPVWGVAFGASILTKYTAIALAPLFACILWFDARKKRMTKGALFSVFSAVGLVIFPILLYNVMLFKTVGHFDLQLSFLFGQETKEWIDLVGKDQRGDLLARFFGWRQFGELTSPFFVLASLVVLIAAAVRLSQKNTSSNERFGIAFVLGAFFSFAGLTLVTGSSSRFLFPTIPFLCLLIGWGAATLWQTRPVNHRSMVVLGCLFFLFELFYSVNSHLVSRVRAPFGASPFAFAERLAIRRDPLQTLDRFLEAQLVSLAPEVVADMGHPILNDVIDRYALARAETKEKTAPVVLVVDPRMPLHLYHWNMLRRTLFEGWPAVTTDQLPSFLSRTKNDGRAYRFFFFLPDDLEKYRGSEAASPLHPDHLGEILEKAGVVGTALLAQDGTRVFRSYHFSREDMIYLTSAF